MLTYILHSWGTDYSCNHALSLNLIEQFCGLNLTKLQPLSVSFYYHDHQLTIYLLATEIGL